MSPRTLAFTSTVGAGPVTTSSSCAITPAVTSEWNLMSPCFETHTFRTKSSIAKLRWHAVKSVRKTFFRTLTWRKPWWTDPSSALPEQINCPSEPDQDWSSEAKALTPCTLPLGWMLWASQGNLSAYREHVLRDTTALCQMFNIMQLLIPERFSSDWMDWYEFCLAFKCRFVVVWQH